MGKILYTRMLLGKLDPVPQIINNSRPRRNSGKYMLSTWGWEVGGTNCCCDLSVNSINCNPIIWLTILLLLETHPLAGHWGWEGEGEGWHPLCSSKSNALSAMLLNIDLTVKEWENQSSTRPKALSSYNTHIHLSIHPSIQSVCLSVRQTSDLVRWGAAGFICSSGSWTGLIQDKPVQIWILITTILSKMLNLIQEHGSHWWENNSPSIALLWLHVPKTEPKPFGQVSTNSFFCPTPFLFTSIFI